MPIQFFLPLITSMLQAGMAGGMQANAATRENNEQARLARMRREELQPLLDRLMGGANHFGVEENLVRDFSRASDQMAAQAASTGMTNAGSGGLDHNRSDLLGGLLAELAQFKTQEQAQRDQLVAALLSDPSMYDGFRQDGNVGGNTLLGILGGGLAGAGSILPAFLSTPEGIAILSGLGGGGQPSRTPPLLNPTVPTTNTTTSSFGTTSGSGALHNPYIPPLMTMAAR